MKTRSWITATAAMAATLFIWSCQKDALAPAPDGGDSMTQRKGTIVPLESVPSHHRQALDYIAAHCDFTGMGKDQVLETCIQATARMLKDELRYPEKEVDKYLDDCLDKMIELKSVFDANGFMSPAEFGDHLDDLAAVTGMSAPLRDKFHLFYTNSSSMSKTVEEMDLQVEKDFDPAQYKGTDREIVGVFRGIWEDSKLYWDTGNPAGREKGCPYWEYANDAIGGVLGLFFGGIGSVALSAGASAYTHWECN